MTLKQSLSIIYPHNQRLMAGKVNDVVIVRTCYALARLGHSVRIITGKPASDGDLFDYYGLGPIPQFEIIQVPMLRGKPFSWSAVFNVFCLMKILDLKKRGMADIIYLREISLAHFLLKFRKLLGLPLVVEVHDLKIKEFYESLPERDEEERFVFDRMDGIIVLLNTFGDILKKTYQISKVPLVKIPLAAERIPFEHKINNHKVIGYIGQLYPMQGVEILIEAMEYLPDARLSVIGGNERDLTRLKRFSDEKNVNERIDFHGFVNPGAVSEKAKEADVMVICALDQGKRRYSAHTKLYEYMAMGKPIVAVDIPSIREEVVDGENAILAKPGDPKNLAEKIARVLNNHDLAKTLAINAYHSADQFSWEKRAARLSDFFYRVYAGHRGKNKPEQKYRIHSGRGKSLNLLFSGVDDSGWFQERILSLLKRKEGVPVKSSRFATVLKFENPDTGEEFFFKEFHERGLKDKLKKFFCSTRSRRAFRAGQVLLAKGFLTPVAVVEGIEKTLFFKGRDFLITQAVPGERTYQYFAAHFRTPLPYETVADKRALIDAAGREIGRLHRAGIFHGDLRVGNIIIDGRSSTARFFFIDNERTQFYREIPEKKRLKNLVQLNMVLLPQITRTDRLRFLRGYLSVNPELVSRRKETVRKVRVLTEKRVREKFSRGPLS